MRCIDVKNKTEEPSDFLPSILLQEISNGQPTTNNQRLANKSTVF
jgi:hypothetical protein